MKLDTSSLIGKTYGRLLVVRYVGKTPHHKAKFACLCVCGTEIECIGAHLKNGNTKSCGCHRVDVSRALGKWANKIARKANTTHGLSKRRPHRIWLAMKSRCLNPNTPNYPIYGGRGITICTEWVESFAVFWEWAAQNGYADTLEIDRIDNDGNYEPSNCRWASRLIQANNKSSNRIVAHPDGRSMTAAEWGRELGMDPEIIYGRIARGWPPYAWLLPKGTRRSDV